MSETTSVRWPRLFDEHREALESRGYREIPELPHCGATLRPGSRIRHQGESWATAQMSGTATVVAIYEKVNSAWAQTWRARDVEIVYQPDGKPVGECPITWAQYHVMPAIEDRH